MLATNGGLRYRLTHPTQICDHLEANIHNKNHTAARYAEAIVQQIAAS